MPLILEQICLTTRFINPKALACLHLESLESLQGPTLFEETSR